VKLGDGSPNLLDVAIEVPSTSSIAESSFSITEVIALSSLTLPSRALPRAARMSALEGAIARGAERGRGVEGADAQVNIS